MDLKYLGLQARDEQPSKQFYSTYFGFDLAIGEDGTVIIGIP